MEAKEFGLYIRKLRSDREMTIRQLELYSGVSNSYLSQMENGKRGIPSPDIIKKLSDGLKADYIQMMKKAGYIEDVNEDDMDEELQDFLNNVTVWYKDEPESKEERLQMMKEMFDIIKRSK